MLKTPLKNTVKLSDKTVKAIGPTDRPQKFSDEKGLYLYVTPFGAKSWRYDYRIGGKRATVTFGQYPDVTLANARKKHQEARTNLANGGHPAQEKKVQKLERQILQSNTFDDIAKTWFESKAARRSKIWRDTHNLYLRRDLSPFVGTLPLAEITAETLLGVLEKCRERSGILTADRVRQTAVQVFDYGKRKLKVSSNVARGLVGWTDGEMPPKKNCAWLKAEEIPAFLDAIDTYSGYLTTKIAAKLLFHTFVRKTELIEAKWAEFSLDRALWMVPPERMKMPTEEKGNRHNGHEVPLSLQTLALLKELKPLCSGSDFLFPSNSSLDKPMSSGTLNAMFKRLGYAGLLTPHGIRGTASTILNEKRFHKDVIELQLAHSERDSVRRAYNHSDLISERRELMQAWADYLESCRLQNPSMNEKNE